MNQAPVLFLPGTLCTGAIFDRQIDALSKLATRIEVVAFSDECHVDDMANRVAQQVHPDQQAAIVGFSMGGMAAMALARLNPSMISGLALLNTNSHAELPGRHARRIDHLQTSRRNGLESVLNEHYLPHYLHRQDPQHQQLILAMAMSLGPACFEAQIGALASRPNSDSTLQGIECPTLIMGASEDTLCPPGEHRRMHHLIEGSELILLQDCGHFSTLEQADAVSDALCDWYRGL